MKFPLKIVRNRKTSRWQSISGPSTAWVPPLEQDESIWGGSKYWGMSIKDDLTDPEFQVLQNKSWVKICIEKNADAIASQTLRLYTTRKMGARGTKKLDRDRKIHIYNKGHLEKWLCKSEDIEEITEHPFLDMVRKVSPIHNMSDMWQLTETYMGLTGNCYWYVRRTKNGADEPFQIWFLESQNTRPIPGTTWDEPIIAYLYRKGLRDIPFKIEEVVHHKYANPNSPIIGLSPMEGMVDAIKTNENIYRYERAQFKNMARPDIAIEVPESMTDEEYKRLKEGWDEEFKSVDKVGKKIILEGGAVVNPITMNIRDLAHLEGRKWTREEIANGYGVPLAMLTPTGSNRSISQVAYVQYMRDTIAPKLRLYEEKINEQLIPMFMEGEAGDIFVAFDDCVPGDREYELKEKKVHLETGYSFINEMRTEEGLDEVDWGDRPILPMSMKPLAEPGEEPIPELIPPKPAGEEEEEEPPIEPEKFVDLVAKYMLKEIEKGG